MAVPPPLPLSPVRMSPGVQGTAEEALIDADVYIGLGTGRRVRSKESAPWLPIRSCSRWRTTREVIPEDVQGIAAIVATRPLGLSQPDQLRTRFPGVFRSALDAAPRPSQGR
jgi:hypothetical protein